MNILDNGIAMAPGKQLDQYARARGLCHLCGQTRTHRKAGRFFKKLRSGWQPLTVKDEERSNNNNNNINNNAYLVYKGYCIQPTCYSLEDAKMRLGEKPQRRASTGGDHETATSCSTTTASSRPPLSSWRTTTSSSPDTSQLPSHPSSPFKTKARLQRLPMGSSPSSTRTSDISSTASNASTSFWSDEEESHGRNSSLVSSLTLNSSFCDVPISIDASSSGGNGGGTNIPNNTMARALPVTDLLDAFLQDPKVSTTLNLSGVELFELNVASIVTAFRSKKISSSDDGSTTSALHLGSLLADRCKLNGGGRLSKLIQGLLDENVQVSKLTLQSNDLDSTAVQSLVPLLRSSTIGGSLLELNLSRNRLGDQGVGAVFSALAKNSSAHIVTLNLSHNQVWSLSDSLGVFLSTNQTLTTLHLEHNFLRDAGAGMLAMSLTVASARNHRGTITSRLETLSLGDNGIGYFGAKALADMLSKNESLRSLRLENNQIGDQGADALLKSILATTNQTLQKVTGLDTNQVSSKTLLSDLEAVLQKRRAKDTNISTCVLAQTTLRYDRSNDYGNDDSLTEITFCPDEVTHKLEPGKPDTIPCTRDGVEGSGSLGRECEADGSAAVAISSEFSDATNDEDSSIDDDDDGDDDVSQCESQKNTRELDDSLPPLPSLNIHMAASTSTTGCVRSTSFRNAVEALDLATPSQHRRLVEGSEQGVHNLTAVCMSANGSEQVGFETVALPSTTRNNRHDDDDSSKASATQACGSIFEATELGIEISLDSSSVQTSFQQPRQKSSSTPLTRYDLEKEIAKCRSASSLVDGISTSERSRQQRRLIKLVSLRKSMPTKQELQQRIAELIMTRTDPTVGRKNSFESERLSKQQLLDKEIGREGEDREKHHDQCISAAGSELVPLAPHVTMPPQPDPTFRLTLFQAAPLSYLDHKKNERHTFPLLDFEYESNVLQQSLRDAEVTGSRIEIEHEIATTDRLSAFFAQGGRRLLHLSCHGHPDWLALENGFGDMQPLFVEDLRSFMEAGGTNLDLVFVSACHSLPAGQAFLKSGVRHVVCAKQDSAFRDEACAEFSRCFYRALACKRTLKQAFKMAKEAVRVSPLVKDARIESDKFLLLPECKDDSYHDVEISFADHRSRPEKVRRHSNQPRILKRVPLNFVGREADMYRIIEALRNVDLVQVYGGVGTGKATLVAAVSKYILQRNNSFLMESAVWLPNSVTGDSDLTAKLLSSCTSLIMDSNVSIVGLPAYKIGLIRIFDALNEQRVLLVFDVRCFGSQQALRNLEVFLTDLLQAMSLKIILIGNAALKVKISSRAMKVGPLDHDSSAILFSKVVHSENFSGPDLAKILAPRRSQKEIPYPLKRNTVIFDKIGRGLPSEIEQIATQISETELLEIVRIGKRPFPQVTNRVTLEDQIKKKLAEEAAALRKKHFIRARDIRDSIEELQGLRRYLRTVEELSMEARLLQEQLERVTKMRRYDTADDIQRQLERLEKQIQEEQRCQELFKEDRFEEIRCRIQQSRIRRGSSN